MAEHIDLGSREMSDDDSSDEKISITSTAASEQRETYPLEGIWAERNNDGVMEYLVKWEGYPEEENTWETHESFQDEEDKTFQDWEEQKMRVSRGYIKPFDVDAWEERLLQWQEATQKRKMRRRNKRIRMGLLVSPLELEPDADDDEEDAEDTTVAKESELDRPTKRRRRLEPHDRSSSGEFSTSTDSGKDTRSSETPKKAVSPAGTNRIWDSRQQSALINGLERFEGPRWEDILSTHQTVLTGFTAADLEDQARVVKIQFQESGRQIPPFLQSVPDKPTQKRVEKKPKTQHKTESLKKTYQHDTDMPADSLVEDLKRKSHTTSVKARNKNVTATKAPATNQQVPMKPTIHQTQRSDKVKSVQPAKPTAADIAGQTTNQGAGASKVSARPLLTAQSRPVPLKPHPRAPTGGVGRGPRKLTLTKITSSSTSEIPVVFGNVLSNWDKGITLNANSSLSLKSKTINKDGPAKVYDKHTIRRRMVKKGRTEPMPDLSSLHFINPKDGTEVKDAATRPKTSLTKTPYQMIQEIRLNESPRAEPAPNDTSWMDKMDDEITAEPASMTSELDQSFQAPQAVMKPTQDANRRAKIPLSTYIQRTQDAPSLPPPPMSTPSPAPPAPPALSPPADSGLSPASSPKNPSQRPRALEIRPIQQPPNRLFEYPRSAPTANDSFGRTLQPNIPSINPHPPRGSQQPSNPRGLEQIIADMGQNEEYLEQIHLNDPSDVFGDICIGPESTPVKVRFRGLDRPTKQTMINALPAKFTPMYLSKLCTAADYEAHFPMDSTNFLGSGFVVPSDTLAMTVVGKLAEILKLHVSGALCHLNRISMLVYPTFSEDWDFLDRNLPPVPKVALRVVLRTPLQNNIEELTGSNARRQKIKKRVRKKGQEVNIGGEQGINAAMRILYEIEYSRLIQQAPPRISSECAKFLLLFPKEAKDEHHLVLQFLSANNAQEIYTYDPDRNDATWNYFRMNVEAGVIIAHSSFWHYHLIPNLTRCLRNSINVWSLSLRKDKNMIHPHLTRLFPHGCMLLLTDSLLLLQPLEAIRVLAWFRLRVLTDKPAGTWKIVTRPGLRNFCLNCSMERTDDEEGQRFVEIYQELVLMLDPEELYDFEEDMPKEEAPVHCMPKIKSFNTKVGRRVDFNRNLDHSAIAKNDEVLFEYFAGWGSCNIDKYRRFHVVTGFDDGSAFGGRVRREQWVEKYSHLEIFTGPSFCTKNNLPSQDALNTLAAKKHRQIIADYDHRESELDDMMRRDELEAQEIEKESNRNWQKMCEMNPKLKAGYEKLERERSPDDEKREEPDSEWDEWSRDNSDPKDEEDRMDRVQVSEVRQEDEGILTPSESSGVSDSEMSTTDDDD